jgi:hypothetical protein
MEFRHTFYTDDALRALTGPEPSMGTESRKPGDSWTGATLERTIEMLRTGYIDAVDRISVIPSVSMDDVQGPFLEWSETGSSVDVGAYLQGEPDCMGEMINQPVPKPVVRIGVDGSTHAGISASQMFTVGRSVLTVVESLRARGYATEVWSCVAAGATGAVWDGRCLIQSSSSPIHVAKLAFWVAHPAALRRAWFSMMDTSPTDERNTFGFKAYGGYGRSMPGYARSEFDEWGPSPELGIEYATRWISEVLGRRA